jgi:membrane-bound ClpP family serine protease
MNLSWLSQLAPTVATALGGPLAGMAVEAVGKALGIAPADAQKILDSGKMTSDQLAQLKQAEIVLQTQAQELGLDFEKLAVQDRASARTMQSETRSWIPGILALVVTIGFFGILIGLMSGKVVAGAEIEIMLGSLGTAWTGIVGFYFGSSASSQKKDELIHQSTPVNK